MLTQLLANLMKSTENLDFLNPLSIDNVIKNRLAVMQSPVPDVFMVDRKARSQGKGRYNFLAAALGSSGGVAQWQSVRFACERPRVRSPAPPVLFSSTFFSIFIDVVLSEQAGLEIFLLKGTHSLSSISDIRHLVEKSNNMSVLVFVMNQRV